MGKKPHADPAESLARRSHRLLVATCRQCADTWHELSSMLQTAYRHLLTDSIAPPSSSELSSDDLPSGAEAVDVLNDAAAPLRRERRNAKKQLSELRTTPRHERAAKVAGASRRFRTRLLAELLIEECRATVRNDPAEAESFAALVPLVLEWTLDTHGPPWAAPLLARGAAHRANALRVAGDLPAADALFAEIRAFAAAHSLSDPLALAEIASLEGSLRIDQHRFDDADERLRRAAVAYRAAGDRGGFGRTLAKHANLLRWLGRPAESLALLDELAASPYIKPGSELTLCAVAGRVNALCDLDRAAEARRYLQWNLDAFEGESAPYIASLLRGLRGRIASSLSERRAKPDQLRRNPMDHLTHADYKAVLQGELPVALLDYKAQKHLAEVCPDGVEAGDKRGRPGKEMSVGETPAWVAELPGWLELPSDPREFSLQHLEACERLLSQVQEADRLARVDLGRLLALPVDEWHPRVVNARTRMRSRAFAVLLIEESKARVRMAAREAAVMATLVRPALDHAPCVIERPWARVLLARADAHRANALRVSGDLPEADQLFVLLRWEIDAATFPDRLALAEITRLEASLRIDQRQFGQAECLLEQTARIYRQAGASSHLGRTLIQQANLLRASGFPEGMAARLDEAEALVDPAEDPALYFATVQCRINALLDLDRPREAGELLTAERDLYFQSGDEHTRVVYTSLRACVDLGLGRAAEAEEGFSIARDHFLALGRDYDAIMISLYRANALLAAGRMDELRDLATQLVLLFKARGVAREALAALRLLAEARRAEGHGLRHLR